MKLIKKNQKYNFLTKRGEIYGVEVIEVAFEIIVVSGVILLLFAVPDKIKRDYRKFKTYNSVAVSNGVETRVDDILAEEGTNQDYKVVYQNDDALLIYVYDNDPSKRYLKTEFVERNIYVIEQEDGTYKIQFNKDDLTEEKYLEFVSELQKNNEDNIQRKRS